MSPGKFSLPSSTFRIFLTSWAACRTWQFLSRALIITLCRARCWRKCRGARRLGVCKIGRASFDGKRLRAKVCAESTTLTSGLGRQGVRGYSPCSFLFDVLICCRVGGILESSLVLRTMEEISKWKAKANDHLCALISRPNGCSLHIHVWP